MSYIDSVYGNLQSLQNYSDGVDATSDNLGHINTPGYKESEYSFSDLISGEGQESEVKVNQSQGDIEFTGRDLQVAVDGKGYLMLTGADGKIYATRNGQLGLSQEGDLILNGTALKVQTKTGSFNIRDYDFYPATATKEIKVSGSINSTTGVGETYNPTNSSISVYDGQGNQYTLKVSFRRDSLSEWSMLISDDADLPIASYGGLEFNSDGIMVDSELRSALSYIPYDVVETSEVKANTIEISDLNSLNFLVETDGENQLFMTEDDGENKRSESITLKVTDDGYFSDVDGKKVFFDIGGVLSTQKSDSYIQKDAVPTENISVGGMLNKDAAIGDSFLLSEESQVVIDKNGNSRAFTVEYQKKDVDEWSMLIKGDDGENLTTPRTVTFLSDGSLSPFSRTFSFDLEGKSINVNLNNSDVGVLEHGTENTASVAEIDGVAQSGLKSLEVSSEGRLIFHYDNGDSVDGPILAVIKNSLNTPIDLELKLYSDGDSAIRLADTSDNASVLLSQDGKAAGQRNDVTFSTKGEIEVRYSNGEIKRVGELSLIQISDLGSAERIGEAFIINGIEYDVIDSASQEYRIIDGAVEGSNVDVTTEFSELMLYQRGYQASSQAMTVAGEMIDELFKGLSR